MSDDEEEDDNDVDLSSQSSIVESRILRTGLLFSLQGVDTSLVDASASG